MEVIIRCNLRRLRKARGYSQKFLADIVNVNRGNLSRYERNIENMNVVTAVKICLALGCTLDDLFDYERSAGGV